jgi:hypothetical protein
MMAAKISVITGAAVLALGLTSPMVARAGCIDLPCPPSASAGTEWRAANFPAPNGGVLVYRILSDGNPACASYDGQNCLWGQNKSQISFARVHPLICGANHRAQWGVTGYENPRHWCNLAKRVARM